MIYTWKNPLSSRSLLSSLRSLSTCPSSCSLVISLMATPSSSRPSRADPVLLRVFFLPVPPLDAAAFFLGGILHYQLSEIILNMVLDIQIKQATYYNHKKAFLLQGATPSNLPMQSQPIDKTDMDQLSDTSFGTILLNILNKLTTLPVTYTV